MGSIPNTLGAADLVERCAARDTIAVVVKVFYANGRALTNLGSLLDQFHTRIFFIV